MDPIRTLEALLTGVGFLGAGTIIRDRESRSVEGLTTASSILLCAGLGAAVASDMTLLAVGVTALTLVTLLGLGWLERVLSSRRTHPPRDRGA